MFYLAIDFSQPLNFITSEVTNMSGMFAEASNFSQPLLFSDTSKVTDMSSMFKGATKFNQPLNFDVAKVTNFSEMFFSATSFQQDLSCWQVQDSDTLNVEYMFLEADNLRTDLSSWPIENLELSSENYLYYSLRTDYETGCRPGARFEPCSYASKCAVITTTHTALQNESSDTKTHTGAIIGGTVGGLVLLGGAIFLFYRTRQSSSSTRFQLIL